MKKVWGWSKDDVWFLSKFKNESNRPANKYASQSEAIQEAEARGLTVEWLP